MKNYFFIILFVFVLVEISLAQNELIQKVVNSKYQDPSSSSSTNPAQKSAYIYQSSDNDNKQIKLNFDLTYLDTQKKCYLNLAIATPLKEGKSQYTPISLDQIESSTYFELAFNYNYWNQPVPNDSALREQYKAFIREHDEHYSLIDKNDKVPSYLNMKKDTFFIKEKYNGNIDEFKLEAINNYNWQPMYFLKIGGKIGNEELTYADTLFNESSNTYWNSSAYLNTGVYIVDCGYLGINLKYENVFNNNDENEYLIPYKNGSYISKKYSIGEPIEKSGLNLQLEYKGRFNSNFGVAPKINYSFHKKLYSVEVPFYFIQNQDKGLSSGLSLGWRSNDTKRLLLTFFLGDVFTVFGN